MAQSPRRAATILQCWRARTRANRDTAPARTEVARAQFPAAWRPSIPAKRHREIVVKAGSGGGFDGESARGNAARREKNAGFFDRLLPAVAETRFRQPQSNEPSRTTVHQTETRHNFARPCHRRPRLPPRPIRHLGERAVATGTGSRPEIPERYRGPAKPRHDGRPRRTRGGGLRLKRVLRGAKASRPGQLASLDPSAPTWWRGSRADGKRPLLIRLRTDVVRRAGEMARGSASARDKAAAIWVPGSLRTAHCRCWRRISSRC